MFSKITGTWKYIADYMMDDWKIKTQIIFHKGLCLFAFIDRI